MPTTYTTARTPASSSKTGVPVIADTRQLSRLARELRAAAPEAWRAYRVAARALAEPVLEDAKQRASYSKRIPRSGKIRVTSGGNIKIIFGGDSAPDAAAIENRGRGYVRHPVFGDRNVWTAKGSHPAFLAPALAGHANEVAKGIEEAVYTSVLKAIGG